ncbi:DUF692 domain-containing protein [Polaromonas sp. YR568]|uniref:DUF692 domain-containing protein n=1 Tax=Polaromonas sp. YR568 TaxID=1855301 RepID=UPI003137C2CB
MNPSFAHEAAIAKAATTTVGIGWRHAHYGEVLEQRPAVDFLEVHSENFFADGGAALAVLTQARSHYPISLHGVGLGLGSACGIDPWHLDQLAKLVARINPVRVSDHACFARGLLSGAPVGHAPVHAADLLPIPFNAAALAVMSENVERVQNRLKTPLLVENLSAYVSFEGSDREEPQFLADLAAHTGCQLLVDVNNLYVNARNARLAGSDVDPVLACMQWLDHIPVGVVGELHVAGHRDCGDVVIDDHGSVVCDAVWQIYRHALQRFGGVPTLVEWDTDLPPLEMLLDQAAQARALSAVASPRGEIQR